jgi:hypothetical protein
MVKSGQKARSTVRLPMKSYARSPKPPLPELCTRPISRPIVYPDTNRQAPAAMTDYSQVVAIVGLVI